MKPKPKSTSTKRLKRARKTAVDKADELQAARDRMRKRRQNETDEQRKERLQKHQQYAQHLRMNETPQEHAQRLEQLRVYAQQQRDDDVGGVGHEDSDDEDNHNGTGKQVKWINRYLALRRVKS